ncbi:uncharacterized protein LOC123534106 [Mercenaria mercenaria]|uniref:uncharacterized protein LOC123534106 n=1 Tax=Mercenaria mercenaria TaxID=6596 RepID=UPI00234E9035|nr:uncharacterized protein LOC123534106 [Mercenaria mercenaria]
MRPRGKKYVAKPSLSVEGTSKGNRPQRKSSTASRKITSNLQNKPEVSKTKKFILNYSSKDDAVSKSNQKSKFITGQCLKKNDDKVDNSLSRKQASPRKQAESIFITPPRNFSEIAADVIRADCIKRGYHIGKTIGEGAYAKVKLAEVLPSKIARFPDMAEHADNEGNLKVAIKIIEANDVPKEFVQKFLPRELENHCPMPPHKNVVRVFEQFRTTDRYYVVMEYCNRGDLLDLINCRISESCKGLGEDRARSLFRMLTEGMHHIHTNGIVHRDLKCENVLLDDQDNLKVTDFGFSTRFIPGQSSLLKTSCGSYAYTAPEVIKQKPYDGTKSDNWSLGIILFAMLNGRLPFNDAQLVDLEEDQKMQRLRFERSVSFESMVLVRRILQYNPTHRLTTAEILNDPWLTGKKLIPRQTTKPKWTNLHQPQPPKQNSADKSDICGSPVYYKGTVPERGSEATVTVNHEKNETVTLKSRTRNKKNIWITGPPTSQRPKTWPRSNKPAGQNKEARGTSCGASAGCRKSHTTVVVKPPGGKKKSTKPEFKARVSTKTIHMSKWFMEKYMAGKEASKGKKDSTGCKCCKAEAVNSKTRLEDFDLEERDLTFLDNGDVIRASSPDDDFRFPSPVKNVPTQEKSERDLRDSDENISRAKTASAWGTDRKTSALVRKPPEKSANTTRRPKTGIPQGAKSTTSTEISKKTNIVTIMVNRSTSPAARVKYFRDRLMKMYGTEKVEMQTDVTSGLPSLLVKSLNSTSGSNSPIQTSSTTRETTRSSARAIPPKHQAGTNVWRPGHHRITSSVKPKKIVILHTPPL